MTVREVVFSDLVEAAEQRAPHFARLVCRFLEQPELPPNAPELPPDDATTAPPIPADAWNLPRLLRAISKEALRGKTATERKNARRDAFAATLAAPNPPPRLLLGDLLIALYEDADEPTSAALLEIFAEAKLGLGIWKAMKAILKLAEARHDVATFGVLAARIDGERARPGGEIGAGTLLYMRRRAWRYLRRLGRAAPELYPYFALEVLANLPADFDVRGAWVVNQIWGHEALVGRGRNHLRGAPERLEARYLDEAYKASPAPLLRLLEAARNDEVARFAIRSLERDFPTTLTALTPEALVRLGTRPLAAVQALVVRVLAATPTLHMSKLRGLGLHAMVLGLLRSTNAEARAYALEYANGYAPDLGADDLADLFSSSDGAIRAWASTRVAALDPSAVGLPLLVALVGVDEASAFASKALRERFEPEDLGPELYVELMVGNATQQRLGNELFAARKRKVPAPWLLALIEDPRVNYGLRRRSLAVLEGYTAEEIGFAWVKTALLDARARPTVERWLSEGKFKYPVLELAWLKSLVAKPQLRALALAVLANPDWAPPAELGADWLLELLRHADEAVQRFAEQHLLHHFGPAALGGAPALFALATSREPAARAFAAVALCAHHPTLASERKSGVEPKLGLEDFSLARVRPLLASEHADVRALAVRLAEVDLVRWSDAALLYGLAESPHKEPRQLAARLLSAAGEPGAPPLAWLDPARTFALAESTHKATRALALTLIRRHYAALGGRERLMWLMESPDRDVRLFAVRLLWEKHRPHGPSPTFQPKPTQDGAPYAPPLGALTDAHDPLRAFLRTSLFGLPPGRVERRDGADLADRALPASVAKARLIEVVRDMAIEDAAFAALVTPVLEALTRSAARGEWQASVAALARIRTAHAEKAHAEKAHTQP